MVSLSEGDFRAIPVSSTVFQNCPFSPQMLVSRERNISAGIWYLFFHLQETWNLLAFSLLVMSRVWILYSFSCSSCWSLLILEDIWRDLDLSLRTIILTCPEIDLTPYIKCVKMWQCPRICKKNWFRQDGKMLNKFQQKNSA